MGVELQDMLQSVVQSVQWTYSLFWRFCPQQGMLVWEDGYYNGAIKTRKTVQPMEVSAEEASLQRSQQLRELYDSLSAGDTNQPPARRPCASLSPEDLTESEWFYLMCVSFSFLPGVGLPGKAYAKCQHVWLTGANEVDSSVFSRAILAKSAHIQTVVCIPLMDGVVELGFTEKVHEDFGFIQQVKGFFVDHNQPHVPPPKPALSEQSTSNPTASSSGRSHFGPLLVPTMGPTATYAADIAANDEEEEEEDSESESEMGRALLGQVIRGTSIGPAQPDVAEQSELMQLEMSEDIRVGSPEDASNNLDSDFNVLSGHPRTSESTRRWPNMQWQNESLLYEGNGLQLPPSGSSAIQDDLCEEDTHYSETVSIILRFQCVNTSYLSISPNTIFSRWTSRSDHPHFHHAPSSLESTSQWLLKYILFTLPFLHTNSNSSLLGQDTPRGLRLNKVGGIAQHHLSANHVLAERRRREKLNERFIILRSLVPFVTKMDKASILGDTIEYVKQLRKKIQDLETRQHQMEVERIKLLEANKRKVRVAEGHGSRVAHVVELPSSPPPTAAADMLQVSIIENDALVELQCPYKEGLLLDVMLTLREMRVEVTSVQSSFNNHCFVAQLRAKVKENMQGKKASIVEVKRAITQVVPHTEA